MLNVKDDDSEPKSRMLRNTYWTSNNQNVSIFT